MKKDILFVGDIINEKTLKNREILKGNVGNYPGFVFDHNAFMNALHCPRSGWKISKKSTIMIENRRSNFAKMGKW